MPVIPANLTTSCARPAVQDYGYIAAAAGGGHVRPEDPVLSPRVPPDLTSREVRAAEEDLLASLLTFRCMGAGPRRVVVPD